MSIELYNKDGHICVAFENIIKGSGVQANQFLISDGKEGVLLDPGGNLTYKDLIAEIADYFLPHNIKYLVASHQDPDIIASVQGWLLITDAKIVIPNVWERFLPHFCTVAPEPERIIGVDDLGGILPIGNTQLQLLPAHYLHSIGNLQVYDPVSKILFSGDLGASVVEDSTLIAQPVSDFEAHSQLMEGFHQRYMVSQKVAKYWAAMVRQLDIEWIVPQHGLSFKGKDIVEQFIQWVESVPCGVDLLTQENYQLSNKRVV